MLYEKIKNDLKEAMIAKDSVRMTTLRGLLSGFTNELVAKGKKPSDPVTDEDALTVIKRAVKQRKDSIEQFTKGGRADLAGNEQKELVLVEVYLPETMSREQILPIAQAKKEALGVTDKSKAGILMGAVMKEIGGKADGTDVKAVVDSLF